MLPGSPTPAQMRAATARAVRIAKRRNTPEARAEADRLKAEYAAERLADHITRTVAAAPPLSAAQLDSLAVLLHGGGAE